MTEQELRALVREALSRHVGASSDSAGVIPNAVGAAPSRVGARAVHSSHGLFMIPDGSAADGPCIIEPAVSCNHCGYCKSYGH
jgi:hypothetical protein